MNSVRRDVNVRLIFGCKDTGKCQIIPPLFLQRLTLWENSKRKARQIAWLYMVFVGRII